MIKEYRACIFEDNGGKQKLVRKFIVEAKTLSHAYQLAHLLTFDPMGVFTVNVKKK